MSLEQEFLLFWQDLSRMRDNPLQRQQESIQWPVLLSAAYLFESSSLSGGIWLRPEGRVKAYRLYSRPEICGASL